MREVVNIRKKKRQTINTLNSDSGIRNKDRKISEQFNSPVILLKQLKNKYHLQKDNFSGDLKKPIEKSFFISPTTTNEVEIQIKCLKNNKASGPNSIPKSIF